MVYFLQGNPLESFALVSEAIPQWECLVKFIFCSLTQSTYGHNFLTEFPCELCPAGLPGVISPGAFLIVSILFVCVFVCFLCKFSSHPPPHLSFHTAGFSDASGEIASVCGFTSKVDAAKVPAAAGARMHAHSPANHMRTEQAPCHM